MEWNWLGLSTFDAVNVKSTVRPDFTDHFKDTSVYNPLIQAIEALWKALSSIPV